jgi:hypothetical protein
MKKILAFILCAIMICALPVVASAEEVVSAEGNVTEADTLPTEEETLAESEILGSEEEPAETEETEKEPTLGGVVTERIEVELAVGETLTHEYEESVEYFSSSNIVKGDWGLGILEIAAVEVGECVVTVTERNSLGKIAKVTDYIVTIKEAAETEVAPIEPDETTPPEDIDDPNSLSVEKIVAYVKEHFEEIVSIITVIASAIFTIMKAGTLNKSATTMNNNAIKIAEKCAAGIKDSLLGMEGVSETVQSYKDQVVMLLAEVRKNDAERAKLEENLTEVSSYLKATRLANVELANEVAELLVLANIPNSKKDELYARHLEAVKTIAEAENEAVAEKTEVKTDEEGNKE